MIEVDIWQRLGLKGSPFDPGRCVLPPFGGGSFGRVEAELRAAIDRRPPLILLIGEPGVGRSTLVEKLADDEELAPATVLIPAGSAGDFPQVLRRLLQRLDPANGNVETPQLGRQLMMTLRQAQLPKGAALLILDDADKVDPGLLTEALRLSAVAAARQPLVCLLLVGERDFHRRLDDRLAALMLFHRLCQVTLEPLSAEETGEYVTERLSAAGYTGAPLFTEDAIKMLHRLSHGFPERINRLCRATLQHVDATDRPIRGHEVKTAFAVQDAYDAPRRKASSKPVIATLPDKALSNVEGSRFEQAPAKDGDTGEGGPDTVRIEQVVERVGEAINRSKAGETIRLSPLPEALSEDEVVPDTLPSSLPDRQPPAEPRESVTDASSSALETETLPSGAPGGLRDSLVVEALTPDVQVPPQRRKGRRLLVSALALSVAGLAVGGWWLSRSPDRGMREGFESAGVPVTMPSGAVVADRHQEAAPAPQQPRDASPQKAPVASPDVAASPPPPLPSAAVPPPPPLPPVEVAAPAPPPPPPVEPPAATGGASGSPVPGSSGVPVAAAVPASAMAVAEQGSAPSPAKPEEAKEAKAKDSQPDAAAPPTLPAAEPLAQVAPAPEQQAEPPVPSPASQATPQQTTQEEPPASAPPPPSVPAPSAPAAEIEALMARGDTFLKRADIASAQLFYKRAAAEGSSAGALAMASTLDPVMLRESRIPGARPHPAEAIVWYRRAIDLGNTQAAARLDRLLAELRTAAAGGDEQARAILQSQP